MYPRVPLPAKSLDAYAPIIGEQRVQELREMARSLQGARLLHLNSTAFGGGVAELLSSLIPLMSDLGLAVEWQVMRGADEFFNVTKLMHNSLQGMSVRWLPQSRDIWLKYNNINADLFDEPFDYVVMHDPQPAGICRLLQDSGRKPPNSTWIWRCHIDLTNSQPEVWDFLRPYLEAHDAAIFSLTEFVKHDLRVPHIVVIPPGIDPLTPKNVPLADATVRDVLTTHGVDPDRPFICQVSRFDPWKDPLGVVDLFHLLKQVTPDLQLVMASSIAADDPEGWLFFERVARRAGDDYNIHLLSNLTGVGALQVNAFQRAARVVIQKSIREGFGLTVSEAMWKGTPVVAGRVGGINLQIQHRRSGFLAQSLQEYFRWTLYVLEHPKVAEKIGSAARERVREAFLITRYLRDHLALLLKLHEERQKLSTVPASTGSHLSYAHANGKTHSADSA